NSVLQSIFNSAPVPSAAARAAEDAVNRALEKYKSLFGNPPQGLGQTSPGGVTGNITNPPGAGLPWGIFPPTPPFFNAGGGAPPGVFGNPSLQNPSLFPTPQAPGTPMGNVRGAGSPSSGTLL